MKKIPGTGIVLFNFTDDKNEHRNINFPALYPLIWSLFIHSIGKFLLNAHYELVTKPKILASFLL